MEPEYHPHWVRRQHTGHRAHPKESLPTQSKKDLFELLTLCTLKIFKVYVSLYMYLPVNFFITSNMFW